MIGDCSHRPGRSRAGISLALIEIVSTIMNTHARALRRLEYSGRPITPSGKSLIQRRGHGRPEGHGIRRIPANCTPTPRYPQALSWTRLGVWRNVGDAHKCPHEHTYLETVTLQLYEHFSSGLHYPGPPRSCARRADREAMALTLRRAAAEPPP